MSIIASSPMPFPGRGIYQQIRRLINIELARLRSCRCAADIAIFHDFMPPPAGGGHQFLRALMREFEKRGLRVANNMIGPKTKACVFNSFNFDSHRLRRLRRPGCRMVHRIDGPIGVYRGFDDGTDRWVWQLNRKFADATVLQSQFSLQKHDELGFEYASPVIIRNTPDPDIFSRKKSGTFNTGQLIRIIAASWSDNPNKGADIYHWLDQHLDQKRYSFTFVGRIQGDFQYATHRFPVASSELAKFFHEHDIYLTASKDDPCSNSVLEALACGLPVAYLNSGGHPELVHAAGVPFTGRDDVLQALDKIAANYAYYAAHSDVPAMCEVASAYLDVMMMRATREKGN
jgi:glycosyltransferase involved in cell wall biosynthesis